MQVIHPNSEMASVPVEIHTRAAHEDSTQVPFPPRLLKYTFDSIPHFQFLQANRIAK